MSEADWHAKSLHGGFFTFKITFYEWFEGQKKQQIQYIYCLMSVGERGQKRKSPHLMSFLWLAHILLALLLSSP